MYDWTGVGAHAWHFLGLFRLPAAPPALTAAAPRPPHYNPQDLKGHLYPFCRDQHGSRLVQQQLEAAHPDLVAGELLLLLLGWMGQAAARQL